jgi:hypothetical protein
MLVLTSIILRRGQLTLNDDIPGLNGDLDPLGDLEQFLGVAVPHVSPCSSISRICCDAGGRDGLCAHFVCSAMEFVGSGDWAVAPVDRRTCTSS